MHRAEEGAGRKGSWKEGELEGEETAERGSWRKEELGEGSE